MNEDIRISVAFTDHPKTVKLQRRLGAEAVICLIRLYGWVALNKPLGMLEYASSIDLAMLKKSASEDIEIAAKWQGEDGIFYETLVELNLLDEKKKSVSIHDWATHNPYAFHANDRKNKAKKAAEARWNKQCSDDATSMLRASPSNAPSPDPDPDPDPDPVLSPGKSPGHAQTKFSKDDVILSKFIFKKIQELNPKHKEPNFDKWSDVIRLMRERDKRTHKEIQDLFIWANGDEFWSNNILSPSKLREKWDPLIIKKNKKTRPGNDNAPSAGSQLY